MSQKPESRPRREKIASETARQSIPAVIRAREPMRSDDFPAIRSDEDDQDRHRKEGRAGLGRRVPEDVLHVDGHEDAEHGSVTK